MLLLLGSEWSVYWESNAKEVDAEVDLVRAAMQRGVPIFAICFGAQLVSHALGGQVTRACTPEVGWHGVTSTTFPEILAREWLQWHYDCFTVPKGLNTVARSDVGPQAMVGKRTFACQFHPEATLETITRWSAGVGAIELQKLGIDPKNLCEISIGKVTETVAATNRLLDWFLQDVSSTTYAHGLGCR